MSKATHFGATAAGEDFEIVVTRGVVFHAYDVPGLLAEVTVEGGVISHTRIPDELDAHQARAVAAMLLDAVEWLEGEQ